MKSYIAFVFGWIFISNAYATDIRYPKDINDYGIDFSVNEEASAQQVESAKLRGISLPLGNYLPNKKYAPVYPSKAVTRRIQGWVLIGYSITEEGKVRDAYVIDEFPEKVFSRSSLRTAKRFRFTPYLIDNTPTEIPHAWNLFTFTLSQN